MVVAIFESLVIGFVVIIATIMIITTIIKAIERKDDWK